MSKIHPIEVKTLLLDLINKSRKLTNQVNDEKSILHLQANGEYSKFFFKVTGYELIPGIIEGTRMVYDFTCFPYSNEQLPVTNRQEAQGTFLAFDTWLKLVSDHANIDNSQDSDLRLDIKSKKEIKQMPTETPKIKSSQWIGFFNDTVTKIIAFITAVIALITKIMDLW